DKLDFAFDSRRAHYLRTNVNGRLGLSILDKVLDIPLPNAIVADYLHATLLRHAKTICLYNYNEVMKPQERIMLDKRMSVQRFPHFFNRTIRPLNETHLKATEMRNIFLFCILPMTRNLLNCDRVAHLGLFVTGIRLLHGRPILGDATADQAHEFLTTFYRDHEVFYSHQQNYVLHIHIHYAELYRNHGSEACIAGEYEYINLHPSSQEDGLIGTIPLSNPQQMAITINRTQSLSDDENSDSILGGEDNNEKIDRQADLYSNPNVTSIKVPNDTERTS
ncbi:unnamed protein product, partial [Rotaria sp. Silwood1]